MRIKYEVVEGTLPIMVTVVKSINTPRLPTVKGTMRANKAEIKVLTAEDLDVDLNLIGLKGSPTQVNKIFTPKQRTQGEIIEAATAKEAVTELLEKFAEAKLI